MKTFWTMIGGFTGIAFMLVMLALSGAMAIAGIGMMSGRYGVHVMQTSLFQNDEGQYSRQCEYATMDGMTTIILEEMGDTIEDMDNHPCPFWLDENPDTALASVEG